MGFGKIIKQEETIVRLLDREILVRIYQYDSGVQKVKHMYIDDKYNLRKQNIRLRKELEELRSRVIMEDKN